MSLPPDLDSLGDRLHRAAARSLRRRRAARTGAVFMAALMAGVAGLLVGSTPRGTIPGQPAAVVVVGPPAPLAASELHVVPAADRRSHPCGRPHAATVQTCGPHAFTNDLRPY